jgi:hypothetical protein
MADHRPKPPPNLGSAGRELWSAMQSALGDDLRFTARELQVLRRACALADREAALQEIVETDGLVGRGSRGQTVVHPAVTELRMTQQLIVVMLQRVSLDDTVASPRSQRATTAARARWDRERGDELANRRAAGIDG